MSVYAVRHAAYGEQRQTKCILNVSRSLHTSEFLYKCSEVRACFYTVYMALPLLCKKKTTNKCDRDTAWLKHPFKRRKRAKRKRRGHSFYIYILDEMCAQNIWARDRMEPGGSSTSSWNGTTNNNKERCDRVVYGLRIIGALWWLCTRARARLEKKRRKLNIRVASEGEIRCECEARACGFNLDRYT